MNPNISTKLKTIIIIAILVLLTVVFWLVSSFNARFETPFENPLDAASSSSQVPDISQSIAAGANIFVDSHSKYEKNLGLGYTQKIASVKDLAAQKNTFSPQLQFNISILESLYSESYTLYVQDTNQNIFLLDKPISDISINDKYWSFVANGESYISKPELNGLIKLEAGDAVALQIFTDKDNVFVMQSYVLGESVFELSYDISKYTLIDQGGILSYSLEFVGPMTLANISENADNIEYATSLRVSDNFDRLIADTPIVDNSTSSDSFDGLPLHTPYGATITAQHLIDNKFLIQATSLSSRFYIYESDTSEYVEVHKTGLIQDDVLISFACDGKYCIIVDGQNKQFIKVDIETELVSQDGAFTKEINLFDVYEYINQVNINMTDLLELNNGQLKFWNSREWIDLRK
jgi:hypothetical protein